MEKKRNTNGQTNKQKGRKNERKKKNTVPKWCRGAREKILHSRFHHKKKRQMENVNIHQSFSNMDTKTGYEYKCD